LSSVFFLGDPPVFIGEGVFLDADDAVVYYLPETVGWDSTFAGLPTVLWNPTVPTDDPNFGVQSDEFGFTITGTDGLIIVVEATADLADPDWSPVSTNTLIGGSSYFSDPDWADHSTRVYRLRAP
jgi:hypothetical protein